MPALIVLDTNVLVSGLLSEHGTPGVILDLVLAGEIELVCDERILAEYREVTARPELKLNAERVGLVLHLIGDTARMVAAPPWRLPVPDPDDANFLAASHAASAPLVTGNLKHFPEKSCGGVRVMSPRSFLDSLRGVQ